MVSPSLDTQVNTGLRSAAPSGTAAPSAAQIAALRQRLQAAQREADDTVALLELINRLLPAASLDDACRMLVNDFRDFLQCGSVAIATCRGRRRRVALRAVSGLANVDPHSQLAQLIEAACAEAIADGQPTAWPSRAATQSEATQSEATQPEAAQPAANIALRTLCRQTSSDTAICVPLRDSSGNLAGCWILFDLAADQMARAQQLARAFATPVSNCLENIGRQQWLPGGRLIPAALNAASQRARWMMLAAVGLGLATMFVPVPHKITCRCRLEPVTRRFVAAPFEGTLKETFVEPGDTVAEGALLATMDGREIRWKQAELAAERARAEKQRDAALAGGRFGAAQIAKLEVQRVDLQLRLLEHRAAHLEIRSPLAGVITSGDLQRVQGAPLELGQTLFEVAPLDAMLVEFSIPQDELSLVEPGRPLDVRLDAHPGQRWRIDVGRVRPRAELRDHQSVFVGDAELPNRDGQLRPGMEGEARIVGRHRAIGWQLLHKPWNAIRSWTGW